MPNRQKQFRQIALPLLAAASLWISGCSENERFSYATEADEPKYREGVALLKTGRKQEALTAFLKVIDKRGDDSAESHLEVGLLYLDHINDPLSAIYHFKKFLALRPNSPQAPLVKQRIDAATRDFARTLPAQPIENQLQRVDLVAAMDRLKQENSSLKQELAAAKGGRPERVINTPPPQVAAVETVETTMAEPETVTLSSAEEPTEFTFNVKTTPTVRTPAQKAPATVPTVRTQPQSPVPTVATTPVLQQPTRPGQTPAAKQPTSQTKTNTPSAPAASGRRHVVQPGETLSQISLKHYGNRSRWREIYALNRDVMRSETDLKVGMSLKLP